jgi:GTP cyclohydrolase-4
MKLDTKVAEGTLPHILQETLTWKSIVSGTGSSGLDDDSLFIAAVAASARPLAAPIRRVWTPHRECERVVDLICDTLACARCDLDWEVLREDTVPDCLGALTGYVTAVLAIPPVHDPNTIALEDDTSTASLFRLGWRDGAVSRTSYGRDVALRDQLFDAIDLIQLYSYGMKETSVDRYMRARALQMAMTSRLVRDIQCSSERAVSLIEQLPSLEATLTAVLVGELRTAIEIDFDLLVNIEGGTPAEWSATLSRRLGAPQDFLLEAAPVRRFPGLAISSAALAKAVQWNLSEGFWHRPTQSLARVLESLETDPLSRDERTDIPSQAARIQVALIEVGAVSAEIPVRLSAGVGVSEHAAEVAVTCSLSDTQRGVHMSRFQQVLVESTTRVWPDLVSLSRAIAEGIRDRQKAFSANAKIKTRMFFPVPAPATGTPSLQPAEYSAFAMVSEMDGFFGIGLRLGVMTACPCTLSYSRLSAARALRETLGVSAGDMATGIPPSFTLSQPGQVQLTITSTKNVPAVSALYDAINSVAHLVHGVLKRPDEHELVLRAHVQPQFCEDLARAIGVAAAALCVEGDQVEVSVELDESIHPHRAFARLCLPAERLWQSMT